MFVMPKTLVFTNGSIVTPGGTLDGDVMVIGDRIRAVSELLTVPLYAESVDLGGGYLLPGFVDLHLHGAGGSDFMDGTAEAFRTVLQCHARHGTTSCTPTTTVASHARHLAFFEQVRRFQDAAPVGSRVLGAHLYGPYFAKEARGCLRQVRERQAPLQVELHGLQQTVKALLPQQQPHLCPWSYRDQQVRERVTGRAICNVARAAAGARAPRHAGIDASDVHGADRVTALTSTSLVTFGRGASRRGAGLAGRLDFCSTGRLDFCSTTLHSGAGASGTSESEMPRARIDRRSSSTKRKNGA
jgi:hypothetical protein